MLPKVRTYSEKDVITLFSDTGIQFLDLGCALDLRREAAGEFTKLTHDQLTRLFIDEQDGKTYFESKPEELTAARSTLTMDMRTSLDALDSLWLPVPFFRSRSDWQFDEGPSNWARLRIVRLPEPDELGNTHRITFAFDTHVIPKREGMAYLAPNDDDLNSKSAFRLAFTLNEIHWFLDQAWVRDWLVEVFEDRNQNRDRKEVKSELDANHHIANYLNLLSLFRGPAPTTRPDIAPKVSLPRIVVKRFERLQEGTSIPVDLVLDVGNSRTCGILVEDHGQSGTGLHDNGLLVLRDMTQPEHVYDHPFDSRVEFVKIDFGKEHLSAKSGRHDAFQWVTMARVGTEALKLASCREGTEGATGLSSPKRYLWDEKAYEHGWRLNTSNLKMDIEPLATTQPLANLVDEIGNALYADDTALPVFTPRYSRSSLMTFMLNEVLAQAVMQINGILYRSDRREWDKARVLRTVILTVPPGMPQAERSIFKSRAMQALGLLWQSLGWHAGQDDPFDAEPETLRMPLPKVVVQWDEATCGQLVYLYTEAGENFGGHPEEFFDVLARSDKTDRTQLTIASIDIGGGTTDLVVNDYVLNRREGAKAGSNVQIVPKQRFRDGLKVAGDDIVLDVIRQFVLPSFEKALRDIGVEHPAVLLHELCGAQRAGANTAVLRQQLTLQVFTPLALALLKEYEAYDLEARDLSKSQTYAQWLGEDHAVSQPVIDYVNNHVSRNIGRQVTLDIGAIVLTSNPASMHAAFLGDKLDICKTLASLSEVVNHYRCDILLLTGRPSRLPGIQAVIRRLLPLPSGRILPLQNYRAGIWYPFHKAGLIDDPKTTASVGAMLCWLCANHKIPNFYFSPASLKPSAAIRHIGSIDFNNTIKNEDVLYHDIITNRDDGCIQLPVQGEGDEAEPAPFVMHGDVRLGYRQLAAERWPGSPMYTLTFSPEWLSRYKTRQEEGRAQGDPRVRVYFKVRQPTDKERMAGLVSDRLEIQRVEGEDGISINKNDLRLELNTLLRKSLANDQYWLDSGSIAI